MATPELNDRELVPWAVRRLIRAARSASLATMMSGDGGGHPFASLVTPATAPDLSLLLLLSDLAEHTRYLRDNPCCSVLITEPIEANNPQTTARVTVNGLANLIDRTIVQGPLSRPPSLRSLLCGFRRFQRLADKHHHRLVRRRLRQGRAATRGANSFPMPARSRRSRIAEHLILERCNRDHANALSRIAGSAGDWHMVALDVDGCDLSQGDRVIRIAWSTPLDSPREIREELLRLAGQQT